MPQVTVPGEVRAVEAGDLDALLPGGAAVHFGFPPNAQVRYGDLLFPGTDVKYRAVVLTPDTLLKGGDIYLVTLAQLAGRLVKDAVGEDSGTLDWLAGRVSQQLAQVAARAWGFVPFVFAASAETRSITVARPAHCLVTFSGIFGDPAAPSEIWSWGMTFADIPEHGGTTQELADKARTAYAGLAPFLEASVKITRTRVAFLGDGQHVNVMEDGSYDQADNVVLGTGTKPSGPEFPLQTALCVSYGSTRNGPTGKGRSFLPLQGVPLTGFTIPAQYATQVATAVRDIAAALEAPVGAHVGPHSIISGGTKNNGYSGYSTPVSLYRVGLVPDTMRSRRNQMVENYQVVPA